MKKYSSQIERHSLLLFIILTPLLSLLMALYLPLPPVAVVFIAAFLPTLLAILMTGFVDGRKG